MLKRIIYIGFFFIFLFFQFEFKLTGINNEPLKGSIQETEVEMISNSLFNWHKGSLQSYIAYKFENSIGYSNFLIRLNNQINYSLFNIANSRGILVNDDHNMLPDGYIKSYLGFDLLPNEDIEDYAFKLKAVQDTLESLGKDIIFLITPGKISVYPELIPQYYIDKYKYETNNYGLLKSAFNKHRINYIDYLEYYRRIKDTVKYPLYPKMGIHWSGYAVALAAKQLSNYLNDSLNVSVSKLKLNRGSTTYTQYQHTDYDIGESMNLLKYSNKELLYYPSINYLEKPKSKPKILAVGDSYFESFIGFDGILDSLFDANSRFWFYNKQLNWPMRFRDYYYNVEKLDLNFEILNKDVIIIQSTVENIRQLSNNFIQNLYENFYSKDNSGFLNLEFEKMKKDPEIIEEAQRMHDLLGYPYALLLNSIAKYETKRLIPQDYNFEANVLSYITAIKNTPEWYNKVKMQALENNITIEENLRKNAIWMVNKDLGLN